MSKMCTTNNDKKNDKQKILIVDDEADITTALLPKKVRDTL